MKVLLLADFGAPYYPSLRDEHPGHELIEAYAHESIRNEVASAEVVFGYLTAEQFHAAKKLKWIHTLDAGMEVEMIFIIDTADPLRKVYDFLAPEFENYIGHPIGAIPAPDRAGKPSEGGNYGEPFLSPFVEALKLIGELGAMERHPGLTADVREQLHVRLGEGVLQRFLVDVDHAAHGAVGGNRRADDRTNLLYHDALGTLIPLVGGSVLCEHGYASVEHVAGDGAADCDLGCRRRRASRARDGYPQVGVGAAGVA